MHSQINWECPSRLQMENAKFMFKCACTSVFERLIHSRHVNHLVDMSRTHQVHAEWQMQSPIKSWIHEIMLSALMCYGKSDFNLFIHTRFSVLRSTCSKTEAHLLLFCAISTPDLFHFTWWKHSEAKRNIRRSIVYYPTTHVERTFIWIRWRIRV